ncbi:IS4 family transposase [Clostridium tarantellae]|uniref:IS4 family transposase n=1 Tax=Clostridium tarantellae TaxID=39493 RepID=A0A6I1MKD3_9CLOT|nr:IS4 family transposase [Clostridium tarantellae]MPQ43424.1 IS4 family transposase [Clostridium tarantellae]
MIKINDQEYITTNLLKNLEKMVPLSLNRLKNLAALVFGIVIGESVLVSNIAQELKDNYSEGTEASKIKRIYRFLLNDKFDSEEIYRFFIYNALKNYKNFNNKIDVIVDHTTIEDKFVILQFVMRVGKRSVPLWYKVFRYKEEGNKSFTYVKEGLNFVYSILKPYNFEVTILADRGFKSIDLFKFIEEDLKWYYCIRCTKDMLIEIQNKPNIKVLSDIKLTKSRAKYFYDVKLSAQEHVCNLAINKDSDSDDAWYIANNIDGPKAILRYKRRFEIEETFKDFKSGGFNLEETWSKNITFIKNLYLCISIAYYFVISIGTICMKNKKNKIISVTRKLKGKERRVYSLFRSGLKWIKRAYYQCRKKYYLKFSFLIYEL